MMHENRSMRDGYIMRHTVIDHDIPLINNLKIAVLFVNSVYTYIPEHLETKSMEEY